MVQKSWAWKLMNVRRMNTAAEQSKAFNSMHTYQKKKMSILKYLYIGQAEIAYYIKKRNHTHICK